MGSTKKKELHKDDYRVYTTRLTSGSARRKGKLAFLDSKNAKTGGKSLESQRNTLSAPSAKIISTVPVIQKRREKKGVNRKIRLSNINFKNTAVAVRTGGAVRAASLKSNIQSV